jgi:hypothetical protein
VAANERDLKYIDAAFEKIKSDITNNISDIDKQKRKCLSEISTMRKLLNDHLDTIEKQTVMFLASVLNRYNRTGYFFVIFHGNYDMLFR